MTIKEETIRVIIAALDDALEKSGKTFFTTIEAIDVLQKAGLLSDHLEQRGRPVRRLLQAGRIPHAYKVSGKTGQWVIPHSSVRRVMDKPHTDYSK